MRATLALACLLAASAVMLGAFGAHGLKDSLTPARMASWETASRYQFFGALGLQIAALHPRPSMLGLSLLGLGVVIFSGSLYLLCLTDQRAWGALTPLGGLLQIVAWLWLGWKAWRS